MSKFNCVTVPDCLRRPAALLLLAAAAVCPLALQAAEAGRIVLVHGAAQVANRTVTLGDAVAEGDELSTGKDGYVYLRTIDNGLLILRPSSRARIVAYHVDAANPANTRIKLELIAGVARSVSGEAVKLARQNFRFNTPVAAIGVRGTDFTVYTDQQRSRVTVMSGGIIVSGFAGNCSPEGAGPCEHGTSRELSATQVGQMLEVARGVAVPQLMAVGATLAPDAVAPPRGDEPVAKAGRGSAPASAIEPNLDPQKAGGILQGNVAIGAPSGPPVVLPEQPPVVITAPLPQLAWGRWQGIADRPATLDKSTLTLDKATRFALDSDYAVYRTTGKWTAPNEGAIGFELKQSEAMVRHQGSNAISAATLENGQLLVDFGKARFNTSFDLLTDSQRFQLQAQGVLGSNGQLSGNSQFSSPTNMYVNGAVGPENGMSAAYIFTSRLDAGRIASGITYWTKQ